MSPNTYCDCPATAAYMRNMPTNPTERSNTTMLKKNFYSYAPNTGMQYHETGKAAQEAADGARRILINNGIDGAKDLNTITWGEVTERVVDGGAGYLLRNALRLAYEAEHPQVVDGRMRNEDDDLVLLRNIHETDLLYHDLVLSIAVIWKSLSGKIERFKGYNFHDVQAVLSLLFEKHGTKRGGRDGNMQFFTFDRRFKLQIAIQKKIDFGPELQVAEQKMLEAAKQLTTAVSGEADTDQSADLETLVTKAFTRVDGKLRISAVLELRRIKMRNALWNEAMEIINEAIIVTSKKQQIRLYERNEAGAYIGIPLDIATL